MARRHAHGLDLDHELPAREHEALVCPLGEGCDICTLGPLAGEEHLAWLARLAARFNAHPIPMTPAELAAQEAAERRQIHRTALPEVTCEACGCRRAVNGPCIGYVARRRGVA